MSVVVLAYHELGFRCLELLLERGVEVRAVFTHQDDAGESCWFGSVAELTRSAQIPVHTPEDINQPEWIAAIRELEPDLLLSFHYRQMVKRSLRRIPRLGCFNLHASLLPRYRGRCPLNWQLVHGERESGVTLHKMVARADAGDIVGQELVAVLPNDTAFDLYQRLVPAAVRLLGRCLDPLQRGTAESRPQDEAQATTFGGRRPADGRIEWSWPAQRIHNLVRAVARPWPGAYADSTAGPLMVWRTSLPRQKNAPGLRLGEVWISSAGETFVRAVDTLIRLEEFAPPPGLEVKSGTILTKETQS